MYPMVDPSPKLKWVVERSRYEEVDPIKSARSRNARVKGHSHERKIANDLKVFFPDAHRQPQSQLTLLRKIVETTGIPMCFTDVVAGPYGIECKNRKVLPSLQSTLDQATEDVGLSGKIPLAVHKGGRLGRGKVVCGYRSTVDGTLMEMDWSQVLKVLGDPYYKGHFPHPVVRVGFLLTNCHE